MTLALIAALPFLGALAVGLLAGLGRNGIVAGTLVANMLALGLMLQAAPQVLAGAVLVETIPWMPVLHLSLAFRLDGLGLLFGLLVLGIGLLIQIYARFYLGAAEKFARFFAFLMLFQGAMLGIILSENLLLLLIFWELTSLASFLLIGFWQHDAAARQGARMALAITGAGGLALIGGLLILANIAGGTDLSTVLAQGDAVRASPLYGPALALILLGCFAKSAQVPFHFWLPHAMAAPTPVSAYLHSATMVKAGIFLMARLWPVLAGTPEWFAAVTTAGLATLLLGAAVALVKTDLKAILAYSTVSQLGLITLLLGLGTPAAAMAALFHILNHACFKAALFLCAGNIDHATHTRDLNRLGGLAALMPLTAVIATLATLSMAGVPPLSGFISKEMLLEQAAATPWAGTTLALPVLVTLGALLSAAYSFRLIWGLLAGPAPAYAHPPQEPRPALMVPPALLAGLTLLIGLAPFLAEPLIGSAARAVTGAPVDLHLKLWHGLTPALGLSALALAGGALLVARQRRRKRATGLPLPETKALPDGKALFDAGLAGLIRGARGLTGGLHTGTLSRPLALMLTALLVACIAAFVSGTHLPGLRKATPVALVPALATAALLVATAALVRHHRNRLVALVLVAVVGLIVSVGFFYFSAPDLALTQIAVEAVTTLLMLMALALLPPSTPVQSTNLRRARDALLALAGGVAAMLLAQSILTRNPLFPSIAEYHLANAYTLGGGNNVVNVILVDFRGYDTFGEITVLGIAGLILLAIGGTITNAARTLPDPTGLRALAAGPAVLMLAVITRILVPLAMLVALFLFLRGHQLPGGGFVAGLVAAIALLVARMGGPGGLPTGQPQRLIAWGVGLAAMTGLASWLFARPFLTSSYGYFQIPPFRAFELATAMGFDAGVFLTVLGCLLVTFGSLTGLAQRGRA